MPRRAELTVGVVTEFVDVEAVFASSQAGNLGLNGGRAVFGFLGEGDGASDGGVSTEDSNCLDHYEKTWMEKRSEKKNDERERAFQLIPTHSHNSTQTPH